MMMRCKKCKSTRIKIRRNYPYGKKSRAKTSAVCKDCGSRDVEMPQKQRRLARDSAVLAKLLSKDIVVVDSLEFERPRTKDFITILGNLKIDRSCLVAVRDYDDNLYRSARNLPRVAVAPVSQLNAGDICRHRKMLFTKDAFLSLLHREEASEN